MFGCSIYVNYVYLISDSSYVIFPAADYSPTLPVDVTITSSSGTAVAGQSFTLTCQATTVLMNPTYQWFDDSGTMVGSSSTLTLDTLMESNSEEYSCQVSAGSGADQRFGCGVTRVAVQGLTKFYINNYLFNSFHIIHI